MLIFVMIIKMCVSASELWSVIWLVSLPVTFSTVNKGVKKAKYVFPSVSNLYNLFAMHISSDIFWRLGKFVSFQINVIMWANQIEK